MRIKFFETPIVAKPAPLPEPAPAPKRADRYVGTRAGRTKKKKNAGAFGGLGLMGFLTSGMGGGSSALARSAHKTMVALKKELKALGAVKLSTLDREAAAQRSRRQTEISKESREAFNTFCQHADWNDPDTFDALSDGPYRHEVSPDLLTHLMDSDPGTFVGVMLRANNLGARPTMNWGSFVAAPNPEAQIQRFEGLLPHRKSLAKIEGLWPAKEPFIKACEALMEKPEWQPRLLAIAPLFFDLLEKSPEPLERLIDKSRSDEGRAFLNAFFGAYLDAGDGSTKSQSKLRSRLDGLSAKVAYRLPLAEVWSALHELEGKDAPTPEIATAEDRKKALEALSDPDPKVRLGAMMALEKWVDGAAPAQLAEVAGRIAEPNRGSSSERAVSIERTTALVDRMIERLVSQRALSPKTVDTILSNLRAPSMLSDASLDRLVRLGGPKVWTKHEGVLKNHNHRARVLSNALTFAMDSKSSQAFDAWSQLAQTLQVRSDQAGAVIEKRVALADIGSQQEQVRIADLITSFPADFPLDAWPALVRGAVDGGDLDHVASILKSAHNRDALLAATVHTELLTNAERIDLARVLDDKMSSFPRFRTHFSEPAFRKAAAEIEEGDMPGADLVALHGLLAKSPTHRTPVHLVDAFIGVPDTLRTGDEDADLNQALKQVRDEKTRPVAIARVREILLSTDDPTALRYRFERVIDRVEKALSFRSWLKGGKRAQADLDAQQMFNEVLQPAFTRLADRTDTKTPNELARLVTTSTRFKKEGAVFELPASCLDGVDPGTVSQDTAFQLLEQTSSAGGQLAADSLRLHWKAATNLLDKGRLATRIATATDTPALHPPADQDENAAFVDLLGQAVEWRQSPAIALRTDLLGELATALRSENDKATSDAERVALMQTVAAMPMGRERNALLDEITSVDWSSGALLEAATRLYTEDPPPSPEEWLLKASVGHFPQDPLGWIDFLTGKRDTKSIVESLGVDPSATTVLEQVQTTWMAQRPRTQQALIQECVEGLLSGRVKAPDGRKPAELFDELLDTHITGAIDADPDLGRWSETFAKMLRGLSPKKRGQIIADLVLDPPSDALSLMRTLIGHGGILAVKAGQQLSEDPNVPGRIRSPLSDTLADNEPLTPIQIWSRVPRHIRLKVDQVGPRLGTGSAKQAFLLKLKADPELPTWANPAGPPLVGAVTLPDAAEDLKAVLRAAKSIPEVEYLLRNLEPVVTRELDLEKEAAAFGMLAQSKTGQLDTTRALDVALCHRDCIVRQGFTGETLHDQIKAGPLDKGTKARLVSVHRSLMLDAFDTRGLSNGDKTFVFTDPHLGNIADDSKFSYAFDPGQYAEMSPAEAGLFVRLLVAAGSKTLGPHMRDQLIDELTPHTNVFGKSDESRSIAERLGAAYDEAMNADEESVGHRLQLFFNACSKTGLDVPAGFFAGAKMMHILHGQARDLGLGDHIEETIKDLYAQQLGPWGKVSTWWKTRR